EAVHRDIIAQLHRKHAAMSGLLAGLGADPVDEGVSIVVAIAEVVVLRKVGLDRIDCDAEFGGACDGAARAGITDDLTGRFSLGPDTVREIGRLEAHSEESGPDAALPVG